jgi:hypothetical protein
MPSGDKRLHAAEERRPTAGIASTNATACSIGVAARKIFGRVASRRKPASSIVMVRMIAARRSDQDVDARRHQSGVITEGFEQGLVTQGVHASHQTAAALEDRQADRTLLRGVGIRAQSQLQPFLDQARQGGSRPGRKRPGAGKELIVEIEGGLHGPT